MCNLGEGLIEKSEARGEAKKRREIALKMLQENEMKEKISLYTDMTMEEIVELEKELMSF